MVHEWALAEAIVNTVIELASKEEAKGIKSVCIVLGELQTIDEETLKYAINQLRKNTIMNDTEILFEKEKAEFKCLNCGHIWTFDEVKEVINEDIKEAIHFIPEAAHAFIKCPKCGSSDYEIVKGRGVWIKSINILKEVKN